MKPEPLKGKNVWNCPKCNVQLVEKKTKDYVDERINRQYKYFKKKINLLKEEYRQRFIDPAVPLEMDKKVIELIDKVFEDVLK